MELTEARIQKALFTEFAERSIMVPNCHFRNSRWESDLIKVTPVGLSYEYEIKLTREDFKNELKHKAAKHRYITRTTIRNRPLYANYFSFVCPKGLILENDLWDRRYGLYHMSNYYLREIRRPKKLHDYRVNNDYYWSLAKKLMFKYFNHADKYQVRKGVS